MLAAWSGAAGGSTACANVDAATRGVAPAFIVDVDRAPPIRVRGGGDDPEALVRAAPAATARLAAHGLRWRVPIDVVVHPDVRAFVRATGQTTPTLRAWTTWSTVHLLPRATWRSADDDAVVARLAHELCHAALAQRRATVDDAAAHRAPRFVTEGICSVVAGQARERAPVEHVRAGLASGARVDFYDEATFSYALAHHVFAAIDRCASDNGAALLSIYDRTSDGAGVVEVIGPPAAWLDGCPSP